MRFSAGRTRRVLDFDIENRPLSYWYERPTAEVTAIAACWTDDLKSMKVWLLGEQTLEEMLSDFKELYEQADIVSGHYIRKHDLPILSGAMMELGIGVLGTSWTEDTKMDLIRKGDIPATQEYLSDIMNVPAAKYQMKQSMWREANRLTQKGLELTRARVEGDVRQHMKLRVALRNAGLLGPPKVWHP